MSNYYTSVELGTDTIKILVCNKIDNKYHVIAQVCEPSLGIKKGIVIDTKQAINSIKKAFKKLNEMLEMKITKAVVCIPPINCRTDMVIGSCDVIDYNEITGDDVTNVLKDSLVGQISQDEELITAIPISFKVDEEDNIKDPKGLAGKSLEARVLITTSPKDLVYKILEVLKLSGVDALDVCYSSTADYYAVKNDNLDKLVGAIINIGEDKTTISVYNKGIMIKSKVINVGSRNIDNDITYIYKTSKEDSRNLKENFVVASSRYADVNETYKITTNEGKTKELNQLEISKVVEARCEEILKLAKNELKNLTKREIRYIIVTGGVSELAGFQYILDDVLGIKSRVCNITTMGIRHNKYSSVLGIIKYFDSKLALRGKKVNMLSETDINNLITIKENKENNDNIINKVFGRFFVN